MLKKFAMVVVFGCCLQTVASAAEGNPWSVDRPLPASFSNMTRLDPTKESGYRDKLETLVGYWGIQEGSTVYVSTTRPASFTATGGAAAVVKITLQKSDPVYSSILTSNSGINAAIPFLNLSWGTNEKGQITITNVAQFFVDHELPTDNDAVAVGSPPAGSNKKIVYVETAVLSLVQTAVLKEKTGALSFLYTAFNIGGTNYQNIEGTTSSFLVTLGVRQTICQQLNNCTTNPPKTVSDLSVKEFNKVQSTLKNMKEDGGMDFTYPSASMGTEKVRKNTDALALVPLDMPLKEVVLSGKSIQELMK